MNIILINAQQLISSLSIDTTAAGLSCWMPETARQQISLALDVLYYFILYAVCAALIMHTELVIITIIVYYSRSWGLCPWPTRVYMSQWQLLCASTFHSWKMKPVHGKYWLSRSSMFMQLFCKKFNYVAPFAFIALSKGVPQPKEPTNTKSKDAKPASWSQLPM